MDSYNLNLNQRLAEKLEELEAQSAFKKDEHPTRDAVRTTIYNFLYSEETGLPVESFTEDDVNEKTVFIEVYI